MNELRRNISFLIFYTKAKLEAESFRHFAGYLWWILDPLFGVGVYYLLFKVILDRGGPDYIQFLFVGLVTWKWFGDSVSKGANSILGSTSLMKKIAIKKFVFPTVTILYNSWKFIVIFVFILILYLFIGYEITLNHFFIPLILISQLVLIFGGVFFVASIVPFFPDLNFIIGYFMRVLFYVSGVLFSLERVPEKYKIFVTLNPVAGLIQGYRDVIMYGRVPDFFPLVLSLGLGSILFLVGILIINKYELEYPKLS